MTTLREAINRANSHLRYWRYRRSIGDPISFLTAAQQWVRRFMFERFNIGRGA